MAATQSSGRSANSAESMLDRAALRSEGSSRVASFMRASAGSVFAMPAKTLPMAAVRNDDCLLASTNFNAASGSTSAQRAQAVLISRVYR